MGLCQKGIRLLMNENWIIPLGRMHFAMMDDGQFEGWTINGMNQLDLENLHKARK